MSEPHLSPELEERIAAWLQNVKFRKRIVGGVDETDVWEKIRALNDIYREAWIAERARYDALLSRQAADPTQSETPGDSEAGNQT